MLRKSPASDAYAEMFKNTDFSKRFSKVRKMSKFYLFFQFKILFVSPLFRKWCLLLVFNLIKQRIKENKEMNVKNKY